MAVSGVTDLAGRVLAGRYRLLGSIGAGASGRVYVAEDTRLRRRVAVKVLHAALADDAGFLRRFRTEAQLAASLHHPNIVAVYDWGEDDVPFMVLELLEGGSLRGMLDAGHELTPAQAANVGAQVCDALEHAHRRGLVHRDVKPANLLFDEHGIVRVADFGLARALAEASWTEPAGTVMGTARYAAPEQATGAPLDARADLYALGLVLVESVTGRVPFVADTPIGTLAARTQRSVVAPDEMAALGPVVERVGRPDPDARYPDARAMRAALADAAGRLPPAGPLVLSGLGEVADDPHPTTVQGPAVFDQDADVQVVTEPEPRRRRASRDRRWTALVVPVVLAMVLVAAVVAAAGALSGSGASTVSVPSVVGVPRAEAEARLDAAGLGVAVEERVADEPAGTVLEQQPAAGERTDDATTVRIVVSQGPPPVPLPDVAGQPVDEARAQLEAAGFVVQEEEAYDETLAVGLVVATEPAGGASAPRESVITVIVSKGPPPVPVPSGIAGGSYESAVSTLESVGLVATRSDQFSDEVPEGVVMGTDPGPGEEVPRGGEVIVIVSKGPPLVAVPDVVGKKVETATELLADAGLQADVQNYAPAKRVQSASPAPGTQVRQGTKVTLTL